MAKIPKRDAVAVASPLPLTRNSWFVGVTALGNGVVAFPDDRTTVQLLEYVGCRSVETMDHGTAQCRIPTDWAKTARKTGSFRLECKMHTRRFRVDVDWP
jgi:hypothetical protein